MLSALLLIVLGGCGGRSQSGKHVNPWADEEDGGLDASAVAVDNDSDRDDDEPELEAGADPTTKPTDTAEPPPPASTGTAMPPVTTTTPTAEPTMEPPPTMSTSVEPPPTDSTAAGGGANPPPTNSGVGGSDPIGTGGGGSVGGTGSGGYGAGGSGPVLPDEDGGTPNCEPRKYSYSDSCELYYDNCGQYLSSNCYRDTGDNWNCSCSGENRYYPSLALSGTADSETTCAVAADLCDDNAALLGDVVCEDSGFSAQADYCQTNVTCSQTFDLGSAGVTASYQLENYASCSNYTDYWSCYCDYPSYNLYSSFNLSNVDSSDACQAAKVLCEGDPAPPTGETCGEYSTGYSTTSCDASRSCVQTLTVDEASVDITVNEYSSCQLRNDEWECSCYGDRMQTLQVSLAESVTSDLVCQQAGDLCGQAQWLPSSGEVTCETSSIDIRPSSCSVGLECLKPIPVEGGSGSVNAMATLWLSCNDFGDDTWECSCGDNDESVVLQLTPGDDLWQSCGDLSAECAAQLTLDFRQ